MGYKAGQIVIAARGDKGVLKLKIREIKNGHIFAHDVKKDYNVYDITKWDIVPEKPEECRNKTVFETSASALGVKIWKWRGYTITPNSLFKGYSISLQGRYLFRRNTLNEAQTAVIKHYIKTIGVNVEKVF